MSYSHAYLYDQTGEPVGHVGILVQMLGSGGYGSYPAKFDAAIFSPWPDALGEGVKFAVRTESDVANDATRWRKADEVLHFQAVGQPAQTNVSFVVLKGASNAELANGVRGLDRSNGINAHGIRKELANYSLTFKPLLKQQVARDHLQSSGKPPADAASVRRRLAEPAYTRTTGGPKVITRSICRILHWD